MIQVFLCGGTIDKTYFPDREVFDFSDTHFEEIIAQSRITGPEIEARELLQKDSLHMDEIDRKTILDACKNTNAEKIIVLHGTSTMTETAEFLQNQLPKNKTIVLVGALYPFEHYRTDALFNFGTAIAAVQLLEPGAYITMNGRIWKAGTVQKDVEQAIFVEKR